MLATATVANAYNYCRFFLAKRIHMSMCNGSLLYCGVKPVLPQAWILMYTPRRSFIFQCFLYIAKREQAHLQAV